MFEAAAFPDSSSASDERQSVTHTSFGMEIAGKRLFLDICSGATRPLSQAPLQAGMQVLSVDPLCANKLDLFNNGHYEQLLRINQLFRYCLVCVC